MHACCKKAAIPRKLNQQNFSKGIYAKISTLKIYPLYSITYLPLCVEVGEEGVLLCPEGMVVNHEQDTQRVSVRV